MAKYRLTPTSVLTIGGTAITCVTTAEVTITYSTVDSECEDSDGFVTGVEGPKAATFTLSGELDSSSDETQLEAIHAGGALVFEPSAAVTTWAGTLVPNGEFTDISVGRSSLATFSASYRLNSPTREGTAQ